MLNEIDIRKQFAKRLNYFMEIKGKKQVDLIEDLGLNRSTVSTWCNGIKMPSIEKIDILAEYFNIKRSDLLEDKKVIKLETIAAHHFDGEDWTEEELQAIEDYKAFIRSRRNK